MTVTIENTKLYMLLKKRNSFFIEQIQKVYKYALDSLPKINRVFSNYTGHGIEHSLNIMEYMYNLCDNPELLSDLELTSIIYSALLHDIGMISNEDEIDKIKKDDLTIVDRKYSLVLKKYKSENLALQECIRPIHGLRSMNHIQNMNKEWFVVPNYTNISFREEIGKICAAHNENFEWIAENISSDTVKGSYSLNSQYIAILLRIADYLDIDENRAPIYLYKYLNPKDYGKMEWKQHFIIENKEKIVLNEKTGYKNIEFYGESSNPGIHRKLLKYFDNLNDELEKAVDFSEMFHDKKYLLLIKPNVQNKIRTKGFNFSDFKLTLDYKAVTNLLMGEYIYGDKKYGLRELIQNSIDACKVMQEEGKGKMESIYAPYSPFINIILDQDRKQVSIFDNGKGMSLDILKKYFLNVGVSYYTSDDYLLKGNKYIPIGNYGIGFLACFMLSDNVVVNTKYYGETKMNKIEFEKNSEYICLTYENTSRPQGTEIILNYDQFIQVFDSNINNIKNFIEKNFLDCEIPINLVIFENGEPKYETLNLKNTTTMLNNGIALDKYLNNIQACIECSYKGIQFLDVMEDINGCQSYIYDVPTTKIIPENEMKTANIKDFVQNGEIKFLNIPIIESSEEEEFQKAYEVLEDFNEALERVNYEEINFIAKDEFLYYGNKLIENDQDAIIGEYTYEDFCEELGHYEGIPTYCTLTIQKVIQNKGNRLLSYSLDKYLGGEYLFEQKDYVFIKNVLVSRVNLKIPFLIDGIQIKGAIINIMSKDFIPNVSRNNLNDLQKKELAYAIGKALHLWILEHGKFNLEEQELIRNFINECYGQDNYCMKIQ